MVLGAESEDAVGGLRRHTFFLVLPDPIPVRHGDGFTRSVGPIEPELMTGPIFVAPNLPELPGSGGENVVSLQFLQIPLPPQLEKEPILLTRATDMYTRASGTTEVAQEHLAELTRDEHYATAVAGVTFQNLDRPPSDYGNQDPLTRVIGVLLDWVRGYRARSAGQ